jgi:hypothetical protein
MKQPQTELALDYFDYVAKCFPVMCASDEFDFLPRAQAASRYYDQIDDLDPDVIQERVSTLKQFQDKIHLLTVHESDLERLADLQLLKASVAGVLTELEIKRSWRHNPLLYLKICFIGLDHALTKPASEQKERTHRASARLQGIARLLKQAVDNINSVPKTYHQAALAMASDCKSYLTEIRKSFAGPGNGSVAKGLHEASSALDAFTTFLKELSPAEDEQFYVSAVDVTLRDQFLSVRTLSEVLEIGQEEWRENLEKLNQLQRKINPEKSWRQLYHAYCPSDNERTDTISLYQSEIDRLGRFFREQGFKDIDLDPSLELCETPTYLRSVRGSASFSAAFSEDSREKDFFYITNRPPHKTGKETGDILRKRLHRECRFLAAHETFPGHYLLDSIRRNLKNPVRRQVESPLFYEGWACYAESLLTEYGYVDSAMESLVDCKRRLWRAARCQIDVGLSTGNLTKKDAIRLLTTAGFTPKEANSQVGRFRLNPGYQLCYTLGSHEIMRLRRIYGSRLGRDEFHRQLLEGGELPFHLIEKRFEAEIGRRN